MADVSTCIHTCIRERLSLTVLNYQKINTKQRNFTEIWIKRILAKYLRNQTVCKTIVFHTKLNAT